MGKTKEKRRASPKQKQTKEQVPQPGSRGHSLRTWDLRIQRWALILAWLVPGSGSSVTLLCSSPFFTAIIFFLLTPGKSRDEALSALLSQDWLNLEPLSLSARFYLYLDEIHWSSSFLVLALFYFLSKDFSPFWSVSCWQKDLVSKAWPQFSVNKKLLTDEVICRENVAEETDLEDYDTLAVY